MIVQCIDNRGAALPPEYHDPAGGLRADTLFDVESDREYVVYAVTMRASRIAYYLCGDLHPHYPVAYPAPLFRIARHELSRHWEIAYTPNHLDHQLIIAFRDWIADDYFYDRLTDLQAREVAIFRQMRDLIDEEQHESRSGSPAEST